MKLRREGRRIMDIAAQYGVSPSTVSEAIKHLFMDLGCEDAMVVRALELERIDHALERLWTEFDRPERIHDAILSFTRLCKRRSELTGCDAPARAPVDDKGETVGTVGGQDTVALFLGRITGIADRLRAAAGTVGPGPGNGGPAAL